MNNRETEERVARAFAHAAPDVLSGVLSSCAERKGNVIIMTEQKKKRPWRMRAAAAAAAIVLLLGGAGGYVRAMDRAVASTVSLDVNPSVEITVNRRERVLAVTARNADGARVIGDMDFAGSSLEVTVNALIGAMVRRGYLSELANSILISVDGKDGAGAAALREKLSAEVEALLRDSGLSGAVLSQTVADDGALRRTAEELGVTEGKAQLIGLLTARNPLYSAAELAKLSINELNLLAESSGQELDEIDAVGTASDKAYIGAEKAAALARARFGIADAVAAETALEYEDGRMVYEVSFETGGQEYECEIDAQSGAVLSAEREPEEAPASGSAVPASGSTAPASGSTAPASGSAAADLGAAQAESLALAHFGVAAADARFEPTETDEEHGGRTYEVSFRAGGLEYECEIDARSGAVLSAASAPDD